MGRLLVRSVVGLLFVGHGMQKLAGSFGGPGLEGTGQFFEALGLRPGRRHATAAGAAEAVGGALLVAGLATPAAAAALAGVMVTAIRTVHWKNGVWASNGGYEYNAVLLALLFTLVELGPGEYSLDEAFGIELSGPAWAVAALGAGALGSYLATASASPAPAHTAEAPPAATD